MYSDSTWVFILSKLAPDKSATSSIPNSDNTDFGNILGNTLPIVLIPAPKIFLVIWEPIVVWVSIFLAAYFLALYGVSCCTLKLFLFSSKLLGFNFSFTKLSISLISRL